MDDTAYIQGFRAALDGQPRDSFPADADEEVVGEWLNGWDTGAPILERSKRRFTLQIISLEDGWLTADIYNAYGVKVATLGEPVRSGEEAEILARQFRDQHPELFTAQTLLDTPAISEQKNPDLFGDGKLDTIPEQ